jgi:hypothetical protein
VPTAEELEAVARADRADEAQPLGKSGEQAADAEALGEPAVRVRSTPQAEPAPVEPTRVEPAPPVEPSRVEEAQPLGKSGEQAADAEALGEPAVRVRSTPRAEPNGRAEAPAERAEPPAQRSADETAPIPTTGLRVAATPHPESVDEAGELADEMAESEAMADAGLDDDEDDDAADAPRASRSTGRG